MYLLLILTDSVEANVLFPKETDSSHKEILEGYVFQILKKKLTQRSKKSFFKKLTQLL